MGLRGRGGDVHLCAFDLLEIEGRALRLEPLVERRRYWQSSFASRGAGWLLVLNEQLDHDGALVFEHACLLGWVSCRSAKTRGIVPAARIIG